MFGSIGGATRLRRRRAGAVARMSLVGCTERSHPSAEEPGTPADTQRVTQTRLTAIADTQSVTDTFASHPRPGSPNNLVQRHPTPVCGIASGEIPVAHSLISTFEQHESPHLHPHLHLQLQLHQTVQTKLTFTSSNTYIFFSLNH